MNKINQQADKQNYYIQVLHVIFVPVLSMTTLLLISVGAGRGFSFYVLAEVEWPLDTFLNVLY